MDPDWDDLRIFLAVARTESLSAAGKALKRDPATVGRRIARLEEATGARLFSKSPKGYGLSEAGERLLVHAEAAERALRQGLDTLSGEAGKLTGHVRIGAPDGCAAYVLPRVCAEIVAEHPELELQIVALPRVINLSKREADFAITVAPPTSGRLKVQKITDYHLHLAASGEYLSTAPPLRSRADLKAHRFVGYVPDMLSYSELDFLSEMRIGPLSLASNLVSVQLGLLTEGGGLGITHDFILPRATGLRRVLADEVAFQRSFFLVRHSDDMQVERLARVAELLRVGIRAEIARLEALLDTMA